jgi:hypothetical protein
MMKLYKEPEQDEWKITGDDAIKKMYEYDSYEYETPAEMKASVTVFGNMAKD